MPFIHKNPCSNPIECPKADIKMRKFWNRDMRNWEAKYMFSSCLKMHYAFDCKLFWL